MPVPRMPTVFVRHGARTRELNMLPDSIFKCGLCGAAMGKCNCWEKCSCGWTARRGQPCNNPNTTKCSTKVKYKRATVEEPKRWCPICNMLDTDDAPCKCDYPTQEQLIELLRTIYADESTPERIKRMIEELFRR